MKLLESIDRYLADLGPLMLELPADRRSRLDELADFVRQRRDAGEPARLTFICTHNSRRSHISQLWAAAAAAAFGLDHVETYSGGTEATAFNPRAVAAMRRAGFAIDDASGDNPRYRVQFADDAAPAVCFSKVYDDPSNPQDGFAAVMTCSDADEACPMVRGAALRVALPWDDPKAADGTPEEASTYDARVRQIAAEMVYLFSRV
jgi:arsenate reductase